MPVIFKKDGDDSGKTLSSFWTIMLMIKKILGVFFRIRSYRIGQFLKKHNKLSLRHPVFLLFSRTGYSLFCNSGQDTSFTVPQE